MSYDVTTIDLKYPQGQDNKFQVELKPVEDVSAWAMSFVVRANADSTTILMQKTMGSGVSVLDGPAGLVQVVFNSDSIGGVGTYWYELWRTGVGTTRQYLRGNIKIYRSRVIASS